MTTKYQGPLKAHVAVFLFGLSGLLSKLISLSPLMIVLGRTLFAALTLAVLLRIRHKTSWILPKKDLLVLIVSGIILTLHWFSFFQSIKLSTVAIGLITYSAFPLFVTLIEPFVFGEKLKQTNLIKAFLVFCGLALVIPSLSLANSQTQGALWGILSGLSFAVLAILNRRYVQNYPSSLIAFYQNGVASLLLLPLVLFQELSLQLGDFLLVSFLGIVCTALAHSLFISSMKQIKAHLAALIAGLEPVYGIFMAMLILGEQPAWQTWLGGLIIVVTVLLSTARQEKDRSS